VFSVSPTFRTSVLLEMTGVMRPRVEWSCSRLFFDVTRLYELSNPQTRRLCLLMPFFPPPLFLLMMFVLHVFTGHALARSLLGNLDMMIVPRSQPHTSSPFTISPRFLDGLTESFSQWHALCFLLGKFLDRGLFFFPSFSSLLS